MDYDEYRKREIRFLTIKVESRFVTYMLQYDTTIEKLKSKINKKFKKMPSHFMYKDNIIEFNQINELKLNDTRGQYLEAVFRDKDD
tara:strand:- start:183 stop:440 length:258 start_codon:yes stop_codon:yes gene_type:complete